MKIHHQVFSDNYCPTMLVETRESTAQLRKGDSKVVFKIVWNIGQLALSVSQLLMLMVLQTSQLQIVTSKEHLHLSLGVPFTGILILTEFHRDLDKK